MKIERRYLPASELRVAEQEGQRPKIVGYAALFGSFSQDLGGFREIIRPGAFTETLTTADVRALFNHEPSRILGRNKAGTLFLEEDERGLRVEISPPDTTDGRDLLENMRLGNITQMSFGFLTTADEWRTEEAGTVRELIACDLFDVSPVTYPAYEETHCEIALRSLDQFKEKSQVEETPKPKHNLENAKLILKYLDI